jgi:ubiquitin-like 1-activating enzyme E1 A
MNPETQETDSLLHEERYDRTIRTLTAEVALRVMKSKTAVFNFTGVTAEFIKNIILDGANLTVFDNSMITEFEVDTNFLIAHDETGKSKRDVLEPRLRELNPHVQLEWKDSFNINSYSDNELRDPSKLLPILGIFDLLVVSTCKFKEMERWDIISETLNKPLYIMVSCGLYGFSWIRLGNEFRYVSIKPRVEEYKMEEGELKKVSSDTQDEKQEMVIKSQGMKDCLKKVPSKCVLYYAIMMMYEA